MSSGEPEYVTEIDPVQARPAHADLLHHRRPTIAAARTEPEAGG